MYVVGGVSEARTRMASVMALDPREGLWRDVAPMSVPRSSCGVAALQVCDTSYMLGGSFAFDCRYGSASISCGRIASCCGANRILTQASLFLRCCFPARGQGVDQCKVEGPVGMPIAHFRAVSVRLCSQVGAHGRLFAVGGMDAQEGVHGLVEAYHPEMNVWLSVASLGTPRSGLGVCAV